MSLFGKVKDELQEKIFNDKYENNWWTKSVWKKLNENDSSLIYKAVNMVRDNVCEYKFRRTTNSYDSWNLRKVTEISKNRYNAIKKGQYLEEALERIFVASCDELYNQFNLLSGVMEQPQTRKSIDIIVSENSVIKEMIELKDWNNTNDSPLLSALELLLDYFVYKKLVKEGISNRNRRPPEIHQNLKLSVLAPLTYYDYYDNNEAIKFIKKIINENLEKEKVKFSFEKLSEKLAKKNLTQLIKKENLNKLPQDVKNKIRNWFLSREEL